MNLAALFLQCRRHIAAVVFFENEDQNKNKNELFLSNRIKINTEIVLEQKYHLL